MTKKFLANPRLRLFVGAAMISLSPGWVKLVSVSPTTSGFYRVSIGGAALALFLAVSGRRLQLSRRVWSILILAAVFFALDLWFWHRSIQYVGPGLATLLANFQVFIMMLAGFVLLRQAPRPIHLIAVLFALVGLSMIVGLDWQSLSEEYRLGVIFGLLTAASYAGYLLSLRAYALGFSVMYHLRRQQPQATVIVFAVVPGEKPPRPRPGITGRAKPIRIIRSVLHGLELRLRVRIVIRDMRPGMTLLYSQLHHQLGDGLRGHRRASVTVNRQVSRGDCLSVATRLDQDPRNL